MKTYYFKISGVLKVRADSLEDAQEELEDFVFEFEDCTYNTTPIEVEEDD